MRSSCWIVCGSFPRLVLLFWICRQFLQLRHQMRNHSVTALSMILVVDILHDLAVTDGIIPLLNIGLVPLIKPVPEQRDHRQTNRFLIIRFLLQPLYLFSVLPSDNCNRQHACLLHPVFLHRFCNHFPVQRHPFFLHYTRIHVPPLL